MGEIIGNLDERTLYLTGKLISLEPIAEATWRTAREITKAEFLRSYDKDSGVVQVLYPGPIIMYGRIDGYFAVQVFRNDGNRETMKKLAEILLPHLKDVQYHK